jgi:hypothetical protein
LDGKLVSGSLSAPEGSEQQSSLPSFTYTEKFKEQFPYYLSIGMTPEQYWEGDPEWAKFFREAYEIKLERRNQELWLQGMYIYEAICDASPILHSFAKKGTKPHPYADKPYPLTDKQRKQDNVSKEKAIAEKGKKFMEAFMKLNNSNFKGNVPQ